MTTWPGALSLATQHAVGRGRARVFGLLAGDAPSSAAMRPGCASAAACVSSARRAAKRTPSSRSSTPAAMSAVTWPSEWPANATMSSSIGRGRFPRDERGAQHRELRVCACERAARPARRAAGVRAARRARPRPARRSSTPVVVLPRRAHAGLLRSLAGEHDGDAQDRPPRRSGGVSEGRKRLDRSLRGRVTRARVDRVHGA